MGEILLGASNYNRDAVRIDVGLIGGTGIGDRLSELGGTPLFVPTPHGMLRGKRVEIAGRGVLLLKRHSAGHKVPPHRVNYRAMAAGLAALGVKACFASAAVGSLRGDWGPGSLVACDDFLDFTFRNPTMFDRTVVHTDFSNPFSERTHVALMNAALELRETVHPAGVYVCGNGPRYETPKEIQMYRQLGGELVGMTAATEAILMREAGVDYGCLAVVTNLAAGISTSPLNHEEVVEEMERSGGRAVALFKKAIELIDLS